MGVNIVPYNPSLLDNEGMSAISIYNNDLGIKKISYNTELINLNFSIEYM